MSHVIIEPTVLSQLIAAREMVEVRDAEGNVVGHFIPLQTSPDVEAVRTLFDLDKARASLRRDYHQGRSLKEIWTRLQTAENNG